MKILINHKKSPDDFFNIKIKRIPIQNSFRLPICKIDQRGPEKISIKVVRSRDKHIFSFNIFSLSQAVIISLVFIVFFGTMGFFLVPGTKINKATVIKDFIVRQTSPSIANQPINYTILVMRSSITSSQYLVPLPKGAKHIAIKNISTKEAQRILSIKKPPLWQLSLIQRQQLVNTVGTTKPNIENVLAKASSFFNQDLVNTKEGVGFINLSRQAYLAPLLKNVIDSFFAQASTQEPDSQASSDSVPNDPAVLMPTPTSDPVSDVTPDSGFTSTPTESDTQVQPPLPPVTDFQNQTDIAIPAASQTVSLPDKNPPQSSDAADTLVVVNPQKTDYVQIDYQTPAPVITEKITDTGKQVTISVQNEDPANPLTNVLAFTKIPEILKVGEEDNIKIQWQNNENQTMQFTAKDLDGNGYLDYVEWIVPHLSEQTFDVIFISKNPQLLEKSIFTEDEQSSVLIRPLFNDGSTNIAFYIPYGEPSVWTWQSETPAIGDKLFSDYWAPTPAPGDYTAVEYVNDHQQFSCSDLSLEDCISDPHFISQFIFKITPQ